jgi:hypothetical protein
VDVLEILVTITLLANVSTVDKMDLIFDSFDMSDDKRLDQEELTISLKSAICGLAKVNEEWSRDGFPGDGELRMLAENIAKVHFVLCTQK